MARLNHWLAKYRRLLPPGAATRQSVKEIIKKELGIELADKDIKVQKKTVYLNLSSVLKNEIFIHREQILAELKEKVGSGAPTSIL